MFFNETLHGVTHRISDGGGELILNLSGKSYWKFTGS